MSIAEAIAELEKVVGKNDEAQAVEHWVSTGYIPLNMAISGRPNGGWGVGRMYELYGLESSGKTAMATKAMINAQEMGGVAIFIDYERSFDVDMAVNMGLNIEMPYWIYKAPDTWEQGNTYAAQAAAVLRKKNAIPKEAPIVVVQDSIASAVPHSVFEKGENFDMYNMNDTTALARVTSTTLKNMAQFARKDNFVALYLNQVREKPGVIYGDNTTTPGGNAMKFYATGRIQLVRKNVMKKDAAGNDMMDYQMITAKVKKTKLTRPFQQTEWRISFDEYDRPYFDTIASYIQLGKSKKLFGASTRLEWDGKTYHAAQLAAKIEKEGLLSQLEQLVLGDVINKES